MSFACETSRSGATALFALGLRNQLPLLVTERLVLRAPNVEDFEAFAQITCSQRGAHLGGPMTREDAWADFSQMTATWLLHGHGVWAIGHGGRSAGFVLLGFEPGDREPELGFLLLDEAEGQNIAFEAAEAARDHAFDELGWNTFVSYIDPDNARAITLAGRLGAIHDGQIEQDGDTTLIYRHLKGGRQS